MNGKNERAAVGTHNGEQEERIELSSRTITAEITVHIIAKAIDQNTAVYHTQQRESCTE